MPDQIDLTIIIISWNTRQLVLDTLAAAYANLPSSALYQSEVILVDNHSSDGTPQAVAEAFPQVLLIANADNRGFGPANNQALKLARGRYSLLLNSDALVGPGCLEQLIAFMDEQPRVGLCGVQVLNADGSFQGSYARFLNLWSEFLILTGLGRRLLNPAYPSLGPERSQQSGPVATIQGAFMFARTAALREIGLFDEQFFMYGEENDLSLRLKRAGWLTYYLAEVKIVHLGGQSTRKNWTKMAWQLQKSKLRLFRKHYGPAPALGFKLLVSLAVLVKLGLFYVRLLVSRQSKDTARWGSWADLWNFVKFA